MVGPLRFGWGGPAFAGHDVNPGWGRRVRPSCCAREAVTVWVETAFVVVWRSRGSGLRLLKGSRQLFCLGLPVFCPRLLPNTLALRMAVKSSDRFDAVVAGVQEAVVVALLWACAILVGGARLMLLRGLLLLWGAAVFHTCLCLRSSDEACSQVRRPVSMLLRTTAW